MLAGGLNRAGAEPALLTRDHDREFDDRKGAARAFVNAATNGTVRHYMISGRVRSLFGAQTAWRARQEVRRFVPDVVHLQASIGNDPRLVLASGIRPRRFALTLHDAVAHPGDRVSTGSRIGNSLLVRTAGLIFVHAQDLAVELQEAMHPRAPIVVVPHGIDPGEAQPLPEEPSILFFGRISWYKGLDVLLSSMTSVWRKIPNATLTIAGAGPIDDHPALHDPRVLVRREHVPDGQVPELFATARCVVLPYRQASQSGVGSIAKRFERPLVVTAVGGLPELVGDGSGLVVPPEQPADLAGALITVLSDRQLAERLGSAGGETARGRGDWRRVAETVLEAYEERLPLPSPR